MLRNASLAWHDTHHLLTLTLFVTVLPSWYPQNLYPVCRQMSDCWPHVTCAQTSLGEPFTCSEVRPAITALLCVYRAPASLLPRLKHMQACSQGLLSMLPATKTGASEVATSEYVPAAGTQTAETCSCMLLSKPLLCTCRQQPPRQQVPAGPLLHAAGQAVGG